MLLERFRLLYCDSNSFDSCLLLMAYFIMKCVDVLLSLVGVIRELVSGIDGVHLCACVSWGSCK